MRSARLNRAFRRAPVGGDAPAPVPVSPVTIIPASAVVAAYDAATVVVEVGNVVSGVPDQSPNGWNGMAGFGFQPAWSAADANFGGRPSVTHDGVDDIIDFTLPIPAPGTTPRYYWFIGRLISWPGVSKVLMGGNGGLCQDILTVTSTPRIGLYNSSSVSTNTNMVLGTARRCTALFSNSASDQLIVGSIGGTPASAGNASSPDWHIGGGGAAGQYANWAWSYILIMNRAATVPELAALDAWALSVGYPAGILA